jgi:hypothetical protein
MISQILDKPIMEMDNEDIIDIINYYTSLNPIYKSNVACYYPDLLRKLFHEKTMFVSNYNSLRDLIPEELIYADLNNEYSSKISIEREYIDLLKQIEKMSVSDKIVPSFMKNILNTDVMNLNNIGQLFINIHPFALNSNKFQSSKYIRFFFEKVLYYKLKAYTSLSRIFNISENKPDDIEYHVSNDNIWWLYSNIINYIQSDINSETINKYTTNLSILIYFFISYLRINIFAYSNIFNKYIYMVQHDFVGDTVIDIITKKIAKNISNYSKCTDILSTIDSLDLPENLLVKNYDMRMKMVVNTILQDHSNSQVVTTTNDDKTISLLDNRYLIFGSNIINIDEDINTIIDSVKKTCFKIEMKCNGKQRYDLPENYISLLRYQNYPICMIKPKSNTDRVKFVLWYENYRYVLFTLNDGFIHGLSLDKVDNSDTIRNHLKIKINGNEYQFLFDDDLLPNHREDDTDNDN